MLPARHRNAFTPSVRRPARAGRAVAAVAALLALATGPLPAASPPRVVVTVAPVHSLVAGVADGVLVPHLLLPGGVSPHTAALRPSDARALADADLVIWVGPALEGFLARALQAPAAGRRTIELMRVDGLHVAHTRPSGLFDAVDGHRHTGEERADHAHDHGPGGDPHVWLDPRNAHVIVRETARALAELDPRNAARYRANAAALAERIHRLDAAIAARLAPVRGAPYLVFHDAYQGFENHYGLGPLGAIAAHPGRAPGAARLRTLRAAIARHGVRCVFREPQFEPRLALTVVEGTGARVAVLDPLGAALAPGPDAWFAMMRAIADALAACLSEPADAAGHAAPGG